MTFDLELVPLSHTSPRQLLPRLPFVSTICPLFFPTSESDKNKAWQASARHFIVTIKSTLRKSSYETQVVDNIKHRRELWV